MLETGTQIDKFTIDRVLGQGGMAIVYLVSHHTLGSHHALKVLTVGSKAITERMIQEGRVQARLRHPNVVAVHDVLDVAGQPGLLMEYVDGPALEDHVIANPCLPLQEARTIFRGTLDAVQHAHEHGLIHRDLKPGNILLQYSGGQIIPKVTDFGLAKLVEGDSNLSKTRSGVAMGTPSYMSPEQIRDAKNVDERSDVFALGCILYELFTGAQAFYGEDILEIFNKVAQGDYTDPRELRPDLPEDVAAAIRGALQTDREKRVQSCGDLRGILEGRDKEWYEGATPVVSGRAAAPNPTLLPNRDGAFSATSLDAPANLAPGVAQQTVIRPHRVSAETLVDPAQASQPFGSNPNHHASFGSHPGYQAMGVSQTSLPPPAQQTSPLLLVVGTGLLILLAVGAGVGVTMMVMKGDALAPVTQVAPAATPAPVQPAVAAPPPAPIAPTPAPAAPSPAPVAAAPAPAPAPTAKPTPAEPQPAVVSGPRLARTWQGVAGSGERFRLEIDSQRGDRFTATAHLRGQKFGVSGTFDGTSVSFSESGGMAFTGKKTSRGGWQGTFVRGEGASRAQWFLQPL